MTNQDMIEVFEKIAQGKMDGLISGDPVVDRLVDGGYLAAYGATNRDTGDQEWLKPIITHAGYEYLEELKEMEYKKSIKGRVLNGLKYFVGWVAGLITAAVGAVIGGLFG